MSIVKCGLHYLKHTLHFGLFPIEDQRFNLTAFIDADWDGNHDNYSFTSPYIVYMGGNMVF